jgi:putative membrane protein
MNLSTFAQYYTYPMMGYDGWGWVFMMFFWAVIVVGVLLALRSMADSKRVDNPKVDPMDIIKERYAKGEVTKEQFLELKKDLSSR